MSIYDSLTSQGFLKQLETLALGAPGRALFDGVLDGIIDAFEAERGFLLKLTRDGGIGLIAARSFESAPVSAPLQCISHHAVRMAMFSTDRSHHTDRAHLDRRYRTDETVNGGRRPISISVSLVPVEDDAYVAIYLDHRFRVIETDEQAKTIRDYWSALLRVALLARGQRSTIRRLERESRRGSREKSSSDVASSEGVDLSGEETEDARVVEPLEFHGMWTASAIMIELFETVSRLRGADIPILITGETGTGKSLLAMAVHATSQRSERALLSVNCGAMPDALLESELFGHFRGAFTGAEMDREGLIAQAHGGTLFLDEIGDMSDEMQKKLLRFLENGSYRPLGGKDEIRGDVRIVSSTRLDLQEEVREGRFRPDLYYRLCGVRVEVPPLRERREDIVGLATRFLKVAADVLGVDAPKLNEDARRWLKRCPWLGNVRELENLMRQTTALGHAEIDRATLARLVERGQGLFLERPESLRIENVVEDAERHAIRQALGASAGNKSRAAELLGVTRKALYRRLVKYGFIEPDTRRSDRKEMAR